MTCYYIKDLIEQINNAIASDIACPRCKSKNIVFDMANSAAGCENCNYNWRLDNTESKNDKEEFIIQLWMSICMLQDVVSIPKWYMETVEASVKRELGLTDGEYNNLMYEQKCKLLRSTKLFGEH